MPTTSYPARTEKNVMDSDGTLIISHGALTGGSAATRKNAKQHNKPWLHIDLNKTIKFNATLEVSNWILENKIEVLNVAGPRSSKDPKIYTATMDVLESAINLITIEDRAVSLDPLTASLFIDEGWNYPSTVEGAVDRLSGLLSLKDKTALANMNEKEVVSFAPTLIQFVRDKFGFDDGNDELLKSIREFVERDDIDEYKAAAVIIIQFALDLQKSHKLRIVK
ncbi:MAG: hypothetical protein JRJ39_02560 [Deltaproteobacteria bacterium]|nr:hypothetical protein [Deltaproteobacteria bacterium]